jgi:hypothetical protein
MCYFKNIRMFKVENERGNRERERNGGESIHRKGKKIT